ncbi:MAG TPA: SUMF1/EgtB/PvdO family nonheme iron enzyme, partial [Saprospiraceae bacterium]|nr:SUMF1/EgtB/PvdO family nonheme iron enzyme [Saprospiraceae bacterium]
WYQSGNYSPGVLNWCYNALMSVEPGAVLITQNDYDTYPVWMLQYALGVRSDVTVLSLPLLENKDYREKISRLVPMQYVPGGYNLPEFLSNLLADQGLLRNNPVYFSAVIDKASLETNKQYLYITGLALKFSRTNFDNLSVLRGNVENAFRTDYLELEFQKETLPEVVRSMNVNYLPAFYLLYKHYLATGEPVKAAKLQRISMQIGRAAGQEEQVRAFFIPQKAISAPTFVTTIKAKDLDKRMKKIKDNFWAGETEVTNAEYEQFLSDLLKNKEFGLIDSCKSAKTDWRALLPEQFRQLTDDKIYEHGHPDDPGHPVQNISYAAALRYCEWITQVYNADTGKKKFKKVLFRLPTKAEWENFAAFGLSNVSYPWGGYYVRNSKGCYLGNYFATEPCKDCPDQATDSNDGGFFTVPADSYFPNNAGLYCVSGNVAEMVAEPGITKGGSWQDIIYYGQIKPEQTYTAPGPSIGFRVVMEVLE